MCVTLSPLYTSQNAFQSIGGLSADDAYAAVGVLADNISNARGATGTEAAFLSHEVDSFMMGAGDTATWVAQEIGNRPLLRWSLEAVSIASGPAQYAIGKVLEPVSEPIMGELTAAAQSRFSTTGHTDVDSGRGATGVLAVGSLVAGTVAGAGVVRALEIFGRFRIAVEGVGAFGGNLRIRPNIAGSPALVARVQGMLARYPDVIDMRTGRAIPFPSALRERVPVDARAPWGAAERGDFIAEWYRRGYETPRGGWENYDIHHIQPREYGGGNSFWNLTPVERSTHQGLFNSFWREFGQ